MKDNKPISMMNRFLGRNKTSLDGSEENCAELVPHQLWPGLCVWDPDFSSVVVASQLGELQQDTSALYLHSPLI